MSKREVYVERLGLGCGILLFLWFGAAFLAVAFVYISAHHAVGAWPTFKSRLSTMGLWAGSLGGFLAVVDWLTPAPSKSAIKERMVSLWVWLGEQRAGRFVAPLYKTTVQRAFVIVTHIAVASIIFSFLGKSFGYFKHWNVTLELGHPRLYLFQVWVDIAAIVLSSWIFGWKLYPRIAAWIASAHSLWAYFKRGLGVYASFWILLFALLLLQSPIFNVMSKNLDFDNPLAMTKAIEVALHGKAIVVVMHAATAIMTAPVVAGLLTLQSVVFLSFYWLVLIWTAILAFRILQYFIERIVAGNQGPVFAVSVLLLAISGTMKILS